MLKTICAAALALCLGACCTGNNGSHQATAKERALLEAKYFAGSDVRSLAVTLGISAKAAESRLTRARAELRRQLIAELSRHE